MPTRFAHSTSETRDHPWRSFSAAQCASTSIKAVGGSLQTRAASRSCGAPRCCGRSLAVARREQGESGRAPRARADERSRIGSGLRRARSRSAGTGRRPRPTSELTETLCSVRHWPSCACARSEVTGPFSSRHGRMAVSHTADTQLTRDARRRNPHPPSKKPTADGAPRRARRRGKRVGARRDRPEITRAPAGRLPSARVTTRVVPAAIDTVMAFTV